MANTPTQPVTLLRAADHGADIIEDTGPVGRSAPIDLVAVKPA